MAQQINLFDPALQKKRDWFALKNVVLGALLLSVLVAAAGTWVRQPLAVLKTQADNNESQLKVMRDQIVVLGQRVANRKPDSRLEQELASTRQQLAVRQQILDTLQQYLGSDAGSFADQLRGFARQSVNGLWLTGVTVNNASGNMEIRGRTIDAALLPEYIRRLNREPALQGRSFSALKISEGTLEPSATSGTVTRQAAAEAGKKAPYLDFTLSPVNTGARSSGSAGGGQS